MRSSSLLASACLAIVLTIGFAAGARAEHWPMFQGDAGHSSHQPVDPVTMPLRSVYALTQPSERNIRTSVLTSNGVPETQRVIYGTENAAGDGNVHLQILATGAPVGPEAGVDVDDGPNDADTFLPDLVETSTPSGHGRVVVVHNDEDQEGPDDIAIAEIDEASGQLVADTAVQGTHGHTAYGRAVITDPEPDGTRALFFTATRDTSPYTSRLFRVTLDETGVGAPSVGAIASRVVEGGVGLRALAFLPDQSGIPQLHVLVVGTQEMDRPDSWPPCPGGFDGYLAGLRASDLTDGPRARWRCAPVDDVVVPVTRSGTLPGTPGSGPAAAPAIFVEVTTVQYEYFPALLRLEPVAGGFAQRATWRSQKGGVSYSGGVVALSTSTIAGDAGLEEGRVIVDDTGDQRLFDAELVERSHYRASGTTSTSGGFVFLAEPTGRLEVLREGDGQPVAASDFTADPRAAVAKSSSGPPAISHGYVQHGTDAGLFVYSDTPAPTDGTSPPATSTTGGGSPTAAADRPRLAPTRVVVVVPRRLGRGVRMLRVRGRVVPPAGSAPRCVPGRSLVAVRVRGGGGTAAARSLSLRSDCTFRGRLRLPLAGRSARVRRLAVQVRFLGNRDLLPKRARTRLVRRSAAAASPAA